MIRRYIADDSTFPDVVYLVMILGTTIEPAIAYYQVKSAEYHDWYSDLYKDKVSADYANFYIHFRGGFTCFILGSGFISWAVMLNGRQAFAVAYPYTYSMLVLCACAAINVLTRWLLELYAHAPKSINIPRWLAQTLQKRDPSQIKWYFGKFYSKSSLTKKMEMIVGDIIDMITWFGEQHHLVASMPDNHGESESNFIDTVPPWDDPSAPIHEPKRFSCK